MKFIQIVSTIIIKKREKRDFEMRSIFTMMIILYISCATIDLTNCHPSDRWDQLNVVINKIKIDWKFKQEEREKMESIWYVYLYS